MNDDHENSELVMPFVNVTSVGGIYDDDSYVAGYEAGRIDHMLDGGHYSQNLDFHQVHTVNLPQIDLIAMRHGYKLFDEQSLSNGWTFFRLVEAWRYE